MDVLSNNKWWITNSLIRNWWSASWWATQPWARLGLSAPGPATRKCRWRSCSTLMSLPCGPSTNTASTKRYMPSPYKYFLDYSITYLLLWLLELLELLLLPEWLVIYRYLPLLESNVFQREFSIRLFCYLCALLE